MKATKSGVGCDEINKDSHNVDAEESLATMFKRINDEMNCLNENFQLQLVTEKLTIEETLETQEQDNSLNQIVEDRHLSEYESPVDSDKDSKHSPASGDHAQYLASRD